MAKLTALHPVEHDGKAYAEGDVLTVTDEAQVAQLVASGIAAEAASKPRRTKAEIEADAAAKAAADAEAAKAAEAEADAQAQAQADAAAAQAVLDSQTSLSAQGE